MVVVVSSTLLGALFLHYDIDFLKNRAWPAMKALAEFYLDWLIYDQDSKTWVSSPETSPENSYMAPDGTPAAVSHGAAMGHQIIGEVFINTLKAASILKIMMILFKK